MSNTLIVCLPCPRVSAYLPALECRCRGTCSRGSVISHPPSLKVSPKTRFSPFVIQCLPAFILYRTPAVKTIRFVFTSKTLRRKKFNHRFHKLRCFLKNN
jgi:hypothetical protein